MSIRVPAAARWRATRGASFSGSPLQLGGDVAVELVAGDLRGQLGAVVAGLVDVAGGAPRAARRRQSSAAASAAAPAPASAAAAAAGAAGLAVGLPPRAAGRRRSVRGLPLLAGACGRVGLSRHVWGLSSDQVRKSVRATPRGVAFTKVMSGDVLLSHNLPVAVPSAL